MPLIPLKQKNNFMETLKKISPHHFRWSILGLFLFATSFYLIYQINAIYFENYAMNGSDIAYAAPGVNLNLSPATTSVAPSQTFTVNINLTTAGTPIDGVDIYSLRFNPSILQVVDSDAIMTGVQIGAGSLLPNTIINTVNNSTGVIQFSQSTSGGTNFTGNGVLATITFRGIVAGVSAVSFDFTSGSTADTNVAYLGVDQLESVTNASFTVDGLAPTAPSSLTATAVSTSQINLSWTASTDAVGVTGYKIYRCAGLACVPTVQIATSVTNSHSNTGLTASTAYTYTVSAYDAAGNNSAQSASVSATTLASTFSRTISLASLDGRATKVVSGTLDVLDTSKVLLKPYAYTTNVSGNATISFDIALTTVFLKIKATPFLTRLISVDLNSNITYAFPQLLIGDINQDNIINSIDYSILNTNWFTSAATADLNQDGLVNSIDYSFMNQHWLVTGEQ